MTRIPPLEPPYEPDTARQLETMMPPGVPPILLFRTFANNLAMSKAMGPWGGYELSKHLSLSMRDREIVIDRVCARCHCEYEWGVHVAFFAERVELTDEQISSITHGRPSDECWIDDRDRLLVEAVDSLHETADIDDELWQRLSGHFTHEQALDLFMLSGWYHSISYAANAARVPLEEGVPRFADVVMNPD
jgi:alkylhydroperoxidase family enzyme